MFLPLSFLQARHLGEWRRDRSSPIGQSFAERLLGHSFGGQWIPRFLATAVRAQLPAELPRRRNDTLGLSPGQRNAPLCGHVAGVPGGENAPAISNGRPGRWRSVRRSSRPHGGGGRLGGQGGFGRVCLLPARLPLLPPPHAEPGVGIPHPHHCPGVGSTSLQGDCHNGAAAVRIVRCPIACRSGK